MSDDRANRLRERRRSSKSRAERGPATDTGDAESDESAAGGATPPADGTATDRSVPDSNEGGREGSVKEEQVGTYMYLPERQKRELSRVFNVTKAEYEYEYDEEFEKNRHFYPLLVQFGIETLDDASASEVHDLLDELDRV